MAAAAAVDNIHNSIRTLSQTKRIRVTEFFQDFDKLRSGFVTGKWLMVLAHHVFSFSAQSSDEKRRQN